MQSHHVWFVTLGGIKNFLKFFHCVVLPYLKNINRNSVIKVNGSAVKSLIPSSNFRKNLHIHICFSKPRTSLSIRKNKSSSLMTTNHHIGLKKISQVHFPFDFVFGELVPVNTQHTPRLTNQHWLEVIYPTAITQVICHVSLHC